MSKRNDRTGQIHGVFKGISFSGIKKQGTLWKCVCLSCGAESLRENRYFRKDRKIPQCCLKCTGENHANFKGYKELTGTYLTRIRKQAEERGYVFKITPEYLWNLYLNQNKKCKYTLVPLKSIAKASLDRVDNNKGYVKGNVVWFLPEINRMKMDLTLKRFKELCSLIAKVPNVPEV